MNYRALSDRELVTIAESRLPQIPTPALWLEVLYRLARSCGHSFATNEQPQTRYGDKGPREGGLHVR